MEAYFVPRHVPTVHAVDPQVVAAQAAKHRDDELLELLDVQFFVNEEYCVDIMDGYWGPFSS